MMKDASTGYHAHTHAPNRFAVAPTFERLEARTDLTGRGITIAFLDSGFYPHPDLTRPRNRILAFHDVDYPAARLDADREPQAWDWHGTQTSVTAAGNGFLSDRLYSSLAPDANVVLVKVGNRGRISDESIIRGLDWVAANRDRYGIRIVNLSLGGDHDASFENSSVDMAAERMVAAGIIVVVAAGNDGCSENPRPIPPANAPSVITVGGYDDHNDPYSGGVDAYCSNFGPTIDGLLKPEIIAPAIWVAAPILPETAFYNQAEALSIIAAAPDYRLRKVAADLRIAAGLPDTIFDRSAAEIRREVENRLRERKIVAAHYQHVDGTSFAAPIVASVVAQMLEANPQLTPALVKNILVSSADRAPNLDLYRQGYGMLNARRAVDEAARETHSHAFGAQRNRDFDAPRIERGKLTFRYHDHEAAEVSVAGDFNGWNAQQHRFARDGDGMWRAAVEIPPPGRYEYKFIIDARRWVDDPSNGLKVEDGCGGFHSVLYIAEMQTAEFTE